MRLHDVTATQPLSRGRLGREPHLTRRRMKRSKPLARTSSLKRATSPLSRSKPLGRGKTPLRPPRPADGDSEPRLAVAWKERRGERCPCGAEGRQAHHVIYRQELERLFTKSAGHVLYDLRNRLILCDDCHERHHNRSRPLALAVLPDSAFEFAAERLGPRAFDYLRRRYAGDDWRLDALL